PSARAFAHGAVRTGGFRPDPVHMVPRNALCPRLESDCFWNIPREICRLMALSSMTGFARSHGVCGTYAWAWEIKSVNAKGLDVRLRLPAGWGAARAAGR